MAQPTSWVGEATPPPHNLSHADSLPAIAPGSSSDHVRCRNNIMRDISPIDWPYNNYEAVPTSASEAIEMESPAKPCTPTTYSLKTPQLAYNCLPCRTSNCSGIVVGDGQQL